LRGEPKTSETAVMIFALRRLVAIVLLASGLAALPAMAQVPAVTSVNPTAGPLAGGTSVTVSGTGFTGATTVNFGVTAATAFTVDSDTQVTATAPAESSGTVDITVTTPGGTNPTGTSDHYAFVALPTVTSVSPTAGPTTGGNTVTINGTNLTGATAVSFGGTPATGVAVVSATQITAVAPAGAAATVNVIVTAAGGTSAAVAADQYTFVVVPTVTAVSPTVGPTAGGNTVTITGTGFTGATAVSFGVVAATNVAVVDDSHVTAKAPAQSAATVDVTVSVGAATSVTSAADHYTYTVAPIVTALTPTGGPPTGGNSVIISGSGFTGADMAGGSVKFGTAAPGVVIVDSDTQIHTAAPRGTGSVHVTVTTLGGGTSATSAADVYTYGTAPAVTAVSPNTGPITGGTSVTVTGTNLTGATAVMFGATAATHFVVVNDTQVTATSPAGTVGAKVDVTVITPVGTSPTSAADQFTYGSVPTVTAVNPNSGSIAGGTSVTITGTSFTGATAVKFGGTPATNFTVTSATQITATTPARAAGAVDVIVTTPNGTSTAAAADTYTYVLTPSVSAVSPSSGPAAGGNSVTITGTNLTGVTAVSFGSTAASTFTVNSATQITATAPAGAAGTIDVTVTGPTGTSTASAADHYTYIGAPAVTSISPANGGTAGGTTVTIVGTGFSGVTGVKFGATAASFTVNSATQVTATAPAGTAGTVDVTVTTAGGSSAAVAGDRFTYTTGTAGQVYSYQSTLGVTGVTNTDNAHFNLPAAGAVDAANSHLFVADAGNHRVQVLDTGSLAVVATIGTAGVAGTDNAHLSGPQGVGFDAGAGHVLVADTGNDRIQVFDAKTFAYVATIGVSGVTGSDNGHFNAPAGVHLNPTTRQLYIADTANQRVQLFDAGTFAYVGTLGVSGVAGTDNGHFNQPKDAELNPTTNQIMVADSGNARVQLFDAATAGFARTLGGPGLGTGDNDFLGTPATAAFDPTTNLVLVADGGADARVQVFDALTYGYVLTLGTTGSAGPGNSQFTGPMGIAADPAHARLFIGDRQNDRVQVFSIAAPVLLASVLPDSRSVQVGSPATIFASIINTGATALQNCQIALPVTAPTGLTLSYQTTNSATNALTGTPNTPATIPGNNGLQSFLIAFQGADAATAPAMPIDFGCAGVAPAAVETGVDTIDLTFSTTPIADIIALAATATNNGILGIPAGGNGAFAVASDNIGAAAAITVSVDTGGATLPVTLTICQSNPSNGGQCLATAAPTVTLNFANGATPTFSIFAQATGTIPLNPAASRLFVRFKDASGNLHGSTSVAVQTQ
jgi:hypothetical protein